MTEHQSHETVALEQLFALPAYEAAAPQMAGPQAAARPAAAQPLAQGDVFAVPFEAAGPLGGRPISTRATGQVCLVRNHLGIPRHVLADATPGVRWRRTADRSGLIGLLTVPEGGLVQLRHLGGDHAPISIPAGTWQLRRQRAYRALPAASTRDAYRFIAD